MALLSLEEEHFQIPNQVTWLRRGHEHYLMRNFHKFCTRINNWSPNLVKHTISLLSNVTEEVFITNLEGSLMQLLLALSTDEPLDVAVSFKHLKRLRGHLTIFEEDMGEYVTVDPFTYSARSFKNWLKRVYLLDSRNHFSGLQRRNLVMNLVDPDHYTRVGRESEGLVNLLITCSITFHIKPATIFDIGTPFFSKFSVHIDYLPPAAQEEDEGVGQ